MRNLLLALLLAAPASAQTLRVAPRLALPATLVPAVPMLQAAAAPLSIPSVSGAPVPLPSLASYQALLARQHAGEKLDLSAVRRPVLVRSDGKRLSVMQGSGRYEKLRAGELLEALVPEGDPLPEGAEVLERGVPGEVARAANLLSSRGQAGSNPEIVELLTEGRTFVRVRAPRELLDAPMSNLERRREELEAALPGWSSAFDSEAYRRMSVEEKVAFLRSLQP